MTDVKILLPWPPAKTSPNKSKQGNWWEKSGAAKSYKATCGNECIAQSVRKINAASLGVVITYHPPTLGRIDWDNMATRAKQAWDAVSEAVGIDDGKWWPVTSQLGEKVKGGCIIITLSPDAAQPVRIVPIIGTIS